MQSLPRGLCIPLPIALDENGNFDPASQERLLARLGGAKAASVLSAPSLEPLSPELLRQAVRACHLALGGPGHWAGVGAGLVEDLLINLEGALRLGAEAAVFNPLQLKDAPDPVALFHRQIIPLFEKLGRSLPILLDDSGGEIRLRTRDLKQLSRLDMVRGVLVSGSPKVAGNYLKGARHYKARHEFGVYLSDATLIFPLFRPAQGPLGLIREQWNRMWMGAEHPQGIAPLSAALFPAAWAEAWDAALKGDLEKMLAFERAFGELGQVGLPQLRAALLEEGVFSTDRSPSGQPLGDAERRAWLFEYFSSKKELAKLCKPAEKAQATLPSGNGSAPKGAAEIRAFDVAGIGGVVLDEFRRVPSIRGGDSKVKVQGGPERRPGGVMLNQLSWLSALGFDNALFGRLGSDSEGQWLRAEARKRGLDLRHLLPVSENTEVARIFVDASGEREIYLEPGATCKTRPLDIASFEGLIKASRLISSEISLLPLDSVLALFELAHKHGKKVALDLDIPPSQAAGKAGLGSRAQLEAILKSADFLKTSHEIARELAPSAAALHKKYKKKKGFWVAVTRGVKGSQLFDGGKLLSLSAPKGVKAVDSTGCGDAYMAGLLAGTLLKLPLKQSGLLASAAGAACATSLGAAAPESGARAAILKYYAGPALTLGPEIKLQGGDSEGGAGPEFLRVAVAELQKFSSPFEAGAFDSARDLIREAEAAGKRLHVTGVGKPEYVAGYIASSYSSTGTPAFFLHATEAGHGASGQVAKGDVVIAISNSGETEELKSAVSTVKKNGAKVIGVSGKAQSWLARQSDVFLFAGVEREGDRLNMAPRASVLAEIMVLSALGVELQQSKNFSAEDFRAFHPGGSLGKRP